ncbi:hypothetical protein V8F20_003111 [Naviculisporaceae sp. PSN 640]
MWLNADSKPLNMPKILRHHGASAAFHQEVFKEDRWPGGAAPRVPTNSGAGSWDMISAGKNAHGTWPKDRLNIDAFYHPNPEHGGTFNTRAVPPGELVPEESSDKTVTQSTDVLAGAGGRGGPGVTALG